MPNDHRPIRPGFTLVELVIVVVIVGIIAAIAIPRLSGATSRAAETTLRGDLHTLRNAIGFYCAEHGGALPAQDGKGETFAAQMTGRTNFAGGIGTTDGEHVFGPYLSGIPPLKVGPNAGARGVTVKAGGSANEILTDVGWVFNHKNGRIYANTDDLDGDGVGYDTY